EAGQSIAASGIGERPLADIKPVLEKAEAFIGKAGEKQVAGLEAGAQQRPVFVVHHGGRARQITVDEVAPIGSLRNQGDCIIADAVMPQPATNVQFITDIPDADALAGDILKAAQIITAAADDGGSGALEDLAEIDDILPTLARRNSRRQPAYGDIGTPSGKLVERIEPSRSLDKLDLDALTLIEALVIGKVEAGKLSLMKPEE